MEKQFEKKKKVLVGMSGGVDSAVCALLLQKEGYEVLGVHFVMHKNSSIQKTKEIASHLNIGLMIEDISGEFEQKIIGNFVSEYSQGKTPNPCVLCNEKVKYENLLKIGRKVKVDYVATGHYAKIASKGGEHFLHKAEDEKKDQSYFLYRLGQAQLGRILFPLGCLQKEEVKKIAKENELPVETAESQDVCFFAKQESLKIFLEKHIKKHEGKIVDEQGVELGKHQGSEFFTIGQRQGLKLGGKGPFYVFAKDIRENLVKVTDNPLHPALFSGEIVFDEVHWIGESPKKSKKYTIKTRYQTKGSTGVVFEAENLGRWKVVLDQPQWAVATGQSLVVYDGNKVVGGGIIT